MQIILTLEPIEIVVDLDPTVIDPARLAQAAHDGIAEYVAAQLSWHHQDGAPTSVTRPLVSVRTFVPPTDGVASIEINPF